LTWKFELKRSAVTKPLRYSRDDIQYDIFVCYSSEDGMWVHRKLRPVLEGQLGIRLCIHERDFLPGRQILENIEECIEVSRQYMMVFSKHFVQSPWCQFELSVCWTLSRDVGNRLIIVALPSMTDVPKLTSTMAAALAVEGYVPWRKSAKELFWAYLMVAITNPSERIPSYLRKRLALPVGNNTLDREVCCRFEG
jgi:hypothetical protein